MTFILISLTYLSVNDAKNLSGSKIDLSNFPYMKYDPRVKSIFFICLLILAMTGGMRSTITSLLFLFIIIAVEPSGFKRFWQKSKYFLLLVPLTFAFHIIFNASFLGGTGFSLSDETVNKALYFTYRVGILVSAGAYFTMTVEPASLAESLRESAAPLGKIGVPLERISLLFLLALSFVPIISDQAIRIKEAQIARGISMGNGLLGRVGRMLPVLIPLFTLSLARAERLALVLESRGYGSPGAKTRLMKFGFSTADYLSVFIATSVTATTFF